MSMYFYAACHDCKMYIEAGNDNLEAAEEFSQNWSTERGHDSHNIEIASEYDDPFCELVFNGNEITKTEYMGYQTNKIGKRYVEDKSIYTYK